MLASISEWQIGENANEVTSKCRHIISMFVNYSGDGASPL
jgi:hypothetical protein